MGKVAHSDMCFAGRCFLVLLDSSMQQQGSRLGSGYNDVEVNTRVFDLCGRPWPLICQDIPALKETPFCGFASSLVAAARATDSQSIDWSAESRSSSLGDQIDYFNLFC